jgi:hypothetical protein
VPLERGREATIAYFRGLNGGIPKGRLSRSSQSATVGAP